MSWFNTVGPCSEYVLLSKVKYIRNVSNMPFYKLAEPQRADEIFKLIDKTLVGNGFKGEKIAGGLNAQVLSLAEKHLTDPDFAVSELERYIYLNEPCNLSVSVGGKELITVQSVMAGRAVSEARNTASVAEELLDRELEFAYNENIGYLSADPRRCGSGIELSAVMYLPSLRLDGNFRTGINTDISEICIEPLFKYADNAGDLYLLTYSPKYLSDEGASTEYFSRTVDKIASDERERERMIFPNTDNDICNTAFRALGILLHARRLGECEMLSLLSDIRLCRALYGKDGIDGLPDIAELNFMVAEGLNSSIFLSSGQSCTSAEECDEKRAQFTSRYISRRES